MDIGIGPDTTSTESLRSEVSRRGRVGLGHDDEVEVASTDSHLETSKVSDSAVDGQPQEVGQQVPRSLRERTVPRWQAHGALGGTLVAAAGVGTATGVLFGIGKGAAIGAAFGSIIPGAGTVVGAVVGGVVGGLVLGGAAAGVGALIGRLAAGGSERDRAEKLIAGLYAEKKITLEEAQRLKGMSGSDLSALVSISASRTGVRAKADRDAIRQVVLVTAARQGPQAAKQLKAEYQRFMQDAVGWEARRRTVVDPARLRQLCAKALEHVNTFHDSKALTAYQEKREAFEAHAQSFIKLAARAPSPKEMAGEVMDLCASFEAMQQSKSPGKKGDTFDLFPSFEAAFVRAAAASPAPGISRQALTALRAVDDAGKEMARRSPAFKSRGEAVTLTVAATLPALATALGVPSGPIRARFKDEKTAPSQETKDSVIQVLAAGATAGVEPESESEPEELV